MEFSCLWTTLDGNGLSMTRADYLELEVDHRDWLLERIGQQRKAEAAAARSKARRK